MTWAPIAPRPVYGSGSMADEQNAVLEWTVRDLGDASRRIRAARRLVLEHEPELRTPAAGGAPVWSLARDGSGPVWYLRRAEVDTRLYGGGAFNAVC
jgi:hypothetical protein